MMIPTGSSRPLGRTKTRALADERARLYQVLESKGGGSILRGWRQVLDQDGILQVSFQDFSKAIESLNIELDATRLFEGDQPVDGKSPEEQHFSLQELAPTAAALLNKFREWVKKQFGGPAGMFTAFDADSVEYITREGFAKGCQVGKFKASIEDVHELFNCLDFDSGGSVTMDEVMFLELDPAVRDQEMFKLKMRSRFERQRLRAFAHWEDTRQYNVTHRRAQRPWLANEFENLPVLVCQRRLTRYQEMYRKSVQARVAFLKELRDTYCNEVRAWRRGLDPDCNFYVTKVSLRQYLRQRDLPIDFDALWRGMDQDGDTQIALEEVTPGGALQLALFRCWAHEAFGSCTVVWDLPQVKDARESSVDQGHWASNKKMMVSVFAEAVKKIGWPADANSVLYQSLDLYGCGFLSLPDLWWLDAWQPPEWLVARPDPEALVDLQACMHEQCSHPLVAWRGIMDMDNDNLVSWVEFKNACRKVGFQGSVGAAWRMLDRDVSGTITLHEWDPKGAELLASFRSWAEAHFGSVELAFKAFDKEGSGSVTLADLKQACRKLKWDGDVKALFQCLNAKGNVTGDEGKARHLVLKDVDFLDRWVDHDELKWALMQMEGERTGMATLRRRNTVTDISGVPAWVNRLAVPKKDQQIVQDEGHREAAEETTATALHRSNGLASLTKGTAGTTHLLPVSKKEKLLRSYHVLAYSKKKRPWDAKVEKTRAKSAASLPWLDKINQIDGACGSLPLL